MKSFWNRFKRSAKVIGDFQARLILTILYGLLVLPTGLIVKLGGDLLDDRAEDGPSYWKPREPGDGELRPSRRQG